MVVMIETDVDTAAGVAEVMEAHNQAQGEAHMPQLSFSLG